ncbi:MAG: NAD-dependent epimerase/dehydratase family protein, partial [Alphaproteobacteria bacterium]
MIDPQMTIPTLAAPQTALVLGITGAIGGAIAGALAKRGYAIRALARNVATRKTTCAFPVEWVEGDVL